MEAKKIRDLDRLYFRISREGRIINICISDMTKTERDRMFVGRDQMWFDSVIEYLINRLHTLEKDILPGLLDSQELLQMFDIFVEFWPNLAQDLLGLTSPTPIVNQQSIVHKMCDKLYAIGETFDIASGDDEV